MTGSEKKLQADRIREILGDGQIAVRYLDTVDSTNEWAKREFFSGAPDRSVFLADRQTAGKGRKGRVWESPEYTSVSMSLLLRPAVPPDRLSMLTLVMGMGAAEGIRESENVQAGIKWPNDVVYRGKKLCGILTEYVTDQQRGEQAVIIGIGINANMDSFPRELADKATSLYLETGHEADREKLTGIILRSFRRYYRIFCGRGDMSELLPEYEKMLVSRNREVLVSDPDGNYEGTALGINERGELLVRRKDTGEIARIFSGEVSVRGIYGYV